MFDMNGFIVKHGTAQSLIKNKDPSRIVTFSFMVDTPLQKIVSDIRHDFHAMLWETVRAYSVVFRERFDQDVLNTNALKLVTDAPPAMPDKDFRELLLDALMQIRERLHAPNSEDTIEAPILRRYSPKRGGSLVFRADIKASNDYLLSSHLIDMLDCLCCEKAFIIVFSLAYINNLDDFTLIGVAFETPQHGPLMYFEFDPNGNCALTIPVFASLPIDKYKSFINKIFHLQAGKSLFDVIGEYSFVSNDPLFPEVLTRFVYALFREFKDSFYASSFNYVGPLREYPQKYYTHTGDYSEAVLSTNRIVELLAYNPLL